MTSPFGSELDEPTDVFQPTLAPRLPPPPARVAPTASQPPVPPAMFVPQPVGPVRPRRRGGRTALGFVLLMMAAGGALYAMVLRDPNGADDAASKPSTETADSALDSAAGLPALDFDRPLLTTALWSETIGEMTLGDDGTATIVTTRLDAAADYTQAIARIDGTQSGSDTHVTVVLTPEFTFRPASVFGAPWTREPRDRSASSSQMDDTDHLEMYQDLVTDEIRSAATNVTTTRSTVEGLAVTMFSFDVDLRAIGEGVLDEIPPAMSEDPFPGHMEVTIDETGLVRRWSFVLDEATGRDALTGEGGMLVSLGGEITSINQPVDVALPTEYVDVLSRACQTDQTTLEVAVEAWLAETGSTVMPTEAQLVTDGMLRRESDTFDLVDGAPVAVAGGPCA